jgi:predicted 3-demethylubiquinone-9 3-methyltransferase (glyoxalase superfamily)
VHRAERRARVQAQRGVLVQVATDDQAETDRYWNAIVGNGGAGERLRLVQGQVGLYWQITPRALTEGMTDPTGGRASARSTR